MTNQTIGVQLIRGLTSKSFVILSLALFAGFMAVAVASSNATVDSDRYLSISTLDSNLMSDGYFVHPANTVQVGDKLHWNVSVYNHMGDVEFVLVRVELLSPTNAAPNDTSHTPAEGRVIFEKKGLLGDNSTMLTPLNWSVEKGAHANFLVVNGKQAQVLPLKDNNLRMVAELYRYDPSQDEFTFSWPSPLGPKDVWNQIWFSIAT